jgi:O-acetyl-ADP-ribose deacetylase (regulator of RNase III)
MAQDRFTSNRKAFCSVSTGIYGYPIYDATHIALDETRVFLESEAGEHASAVFIYDATISDLV